jgi:hypothetical protein
MKTKKHFLTILGTILVLSLVLLSCSTSQKAAVLCPEFSISKNSKVAANHNRNRNKALTAHKRVTTRKQSASLSRKNQGKNIAVFKTSPVQDKVILPSIAKISDIDKIEYSEGLIASTDNAIIPLERNNTTTNSLKKVDTSKQLKNIFFTQPAKCDTIVLKSGSLLIGKVEEIGQTEIKYRKCNNLSGPLISILKSDVAVIIYSNGTHEFLTPNNPIVASNNNNITTTDNNTEKKVEGLGLAGFIAGLGGLFIAGYILGAIAVIFGAISLGRIKKNPNKFKGRGFAIVSFIIGIIDIVALVILTTAA